MTIYEIYSVMETLGGLAPFKLSTKKNMWMKNKN